ncbi:MAG: TolC family protein, partial [Candidatus Atribacteria bacterium]|nr:TolC family protein [Candidatus Atribacteria bacterium]MCD6350006.1 TolC family protein [Candidatus Atribacteria bacterium]
MKRILFFAGLLVLVMLLFSLAGAQEKVPSLSLEEAIKKGIEEGKDAALYRIQLQVARNAYQKAMADLLLNPSVISELSAENSWNWAQREVEINLSNLALSIEEAYYNVLRAEQALQLAQSGAERAKKQLENIQIRFSLGMVARIDLLQAQLEAEQAEQEINNASRDLELAWQNLNSLIAAEPDTRFKLTSSLSFSPVEIDFEKSLNYALSHRLEIQQAEDNLKLAEKKVEVSNTPYTPPLDKEAAQLEKEQRSIQLAKTRESIELEIREAYFTLKNAGEQVPLQEKALQVAKENLNIAQARFENGAITTLDLLEAQYNLYQA